MHSALFAALALYVHLCPPNDVLTVSNAHIGQLHSPIPIGLPLTGVTSRYPILPQTDNSMARNSVLPGDMAGFTRTNAVAVQTVDGQQESKPALELWPFPMHWKVVNERSLVK